MAVPLPAGLQMANRPICKLLRTPRRMMVLAAGAAVDDDDVEVDRLALVRQGIDENYTALSVCWRLCV